MPPIPSQNDGSTTLLAPKLLGNPIFDPKKYQCIESIMREITSNGLFWSRTSSIVLGVKNDFNGFVTPHLQV